MTSPKSPQDQGGREDKKLDFLKLAFYVLSLYRRCLGFSPTGESSKQKKKFHLNVSNVVEIGRPGNSQQVIARLGWPCRGERHYLLGSYEYYAQKYPKASREQINNEVQLFKAAMQNSGQKELPVTQTIVHREGEPIKALHPASRQAIINRELARQAAIEAAQPRRPHASSLARQKATAARRAAHKAARATREANRRAAFEEERQRARAAR